jgi:hypothetical protein
MLGMTKDIHTALVNRSCTSPGFVEKTSANESRLRQS